MIIEMLLNHCSLLKENIEPIYFLGILVLTLFFPSYALKLKNFFNLKQIIILNKKKNFYVINMGLNCLYRKVSSEIVISVFKLYYEKFKCKNRK